MSSELAEILLGLNNQHNNMFHFRTRLAKQKQTYRYGKPTYGYVGETW